jgi:hypothetical protein
MAGFLFRLETAEGEPAETPTLHGCPELEVGRRVHTRGKALQVGCLRDDDADSPPVLVVEDR